MTWRVVFYSDSLLRELRGLSPGLLARFLRYAERMEQYGPNLGMPHTRAMGDGLFELRLRAAEGIARVLYCTLADRRIVLLHQFVKKTQQTPTRDLRIARERMAEVKNAESV